MRAAQSAAGRAGTVVLEVARRDGRPEVSLQRDNVALLPNRHARRPAGVGVSR